MQHNAPSRTEKEPEILWKCYPQITYHFTSYINPPMALFFNVTIGRQPLVAANVIIPVIGPLSSSTPTSLSSTSGGPS